MIVGAFFTFVTMCPQPFTLQASQPWATNLCNKMTSRVEPSWRAESTMAGHTGEDRELADHDLTKPPLPKLTILCNNWGGLRRRREDALRRSSCMLLVISKAW